MGFAPNPHYQVCTLAACKPIIRRCAKMGDYVIGTGSKKRQRNGYLVFWMRIEEEISLDQYWHDARFKQKKPMMNGSLKVCFGDNIYHKDQSGKYCQEYSFHSNRDGSTHEQNLKDDTGTTDRMLLSKDFAYFGGGGPMIPLSLNQYVHTGRNHLRFSDADAETMVNWLRQQAGVGYVSEPTEWHYVRRRRRLGR